MLFDYFTLLHFLIGSTFSPESQGNDPKSQKAPKCPKSCKLNAETKIANYKKSELFLCLLPCLFPLAPRLSHRAFRRRGLRRKDFLYFISAHSTPLLQRESKFVTFEQGGSSPIYPPLTTTINENTPISLSLQISPYQGRE